MPTTNTTHKAAESVLYNNAELMTPADLNNAQHLLERRALDYVVQPTLLEGFSDGTVVQGRPVGGALSIRESATPGMSCRVYPGTILFRPAADAGQPEPSWLLHRLDAVQTITVDAAHATLDRIDLLSFKVEYDAVDTGSADAEPRVTKTTSGTYTGQTLDKRRRTKLTITYTPGTPDASPVVPATPAGQVAFAQIEVPAADTAITTSQIVDYRTPAGSTFVRRWGFEMMVFNGSTSTPHDVADYGATDQWTAQSANIEARVRVGPGEVRCLDAAVDPDFSLAHCRLKRVKFYGRLTHGGTAAAVLACPGGGGDLLDISADVPTGSLDEHTHVPDRPVWSMGDAATDFANPWSAVDGSGERYGGDVLMILRAGATTDVFGSVAAEWWGA